MGNRASYVQITQLSLIALLLMGAGCSARGDGNGSDGAVADFAAGKNDIQPAPCTPQWSVQESGTEQTLRSVWGSGAADVFVVGTQSTLLHFDGGSWTSQRESSAEDLNAVWGNGPTDVFAAAATGLTYHYDGEEWTGLVTDVEPLRGLWGIDAINVFAVGGAQNGAIFQYNGTYWSRVYSGTAPGDYLYAIWGLGKTTAFAVGNASTIFRYNGEFWVQVVAPQGHVLRGIWGSSQDNVMAVGDAGVILRFNGAQWTPMTSGTTATLYGIWGRGPDEVYAVGAGGTILLFDGSNWTQMSSSSTVDLHAVWGSEKQVFVVGDKGTILNSCET